MAGSRVCSHHYKTLYLRTICKSFFPEQSMLNGQQTSLIARQTNFTLCNSKRCSSTKARYIDRKKLSIRTYSTLKPSNTVRANQNTEAQIRSFTNTASQNAKSSVHIMTSDSSTKGNVSSNVKPGIATDPVISKVARKKEMAEETLGILSPETGETEEDAMAMPTYRRVDPATVRQVYYFDTLALTKKLESKGFTREQAEGCAECLVEIINTTLDHQGRHMITKPQQEIAVQQLYTEILSVKKDLTLLQKSEFSSLKTETQKMSIELNQIQDHLNDEIIKLKGHFSLDLNLEKGRAIEAHAANEKKLQLLHNKIDTEVANLKTVYEKYRNDIFKYAGGSVLAVGSLVLGILRLWH